MLILCCPESSCIFWQLTLDCSFITCWIEVVTAPKVSGGFSSKSHIIMYYRNMLNCGYDSVALLNDVVKFGMWGCFLARIIPQKRELISTWLPVISRFLRFYVPLQPLQIKLEGWKCVFELSWCWRIPFWRYHPLVENATSGCSGFFPSYAQCYFPCSAWCLSQLKAELNRDTWCCSKVRISSLQSLQWLFVYDELLLTKQ